MLLTIKQVVSLVGLSRSTLINRLKNGNFPQPVRLSARRIAWLESDVMNWINSLPKVGAV
jgi:prophage regulatory protein